MKFRVTINVRRPGAIGAPSQFTRVVDALDEVGAITEVACLAAEENWNYVHPCRIETVDEVSP